MIKKKVSNHGNEVQESIYKPTFKTSKIILLSFIFFIIGFFANFPFKDKINMFLGQTLKTNRTCPVSYSALDIKNLIFRYDLKSPVISGRCFGNPYSSLPLESLSMGVSRPSLVPVGVKLFADIKHQNSDLAIEVVAGIGSQILKIENSKLDLITLAPLIPDFEILGDLSLNTHMVIKKQALEEGKVVISSENLLVPSQTIKGFAINNLAIGTVLLDVVLESKNNLKVNKLILGNAESPIISEVSGTIKLVPNFPANSALNLKGKLKISPIFQQSMPILNLFLGGKKTDEKGFFNITANKKICQSFSHHHFLIEKIQINQENENPTQKIEYHPHIQQKIKKLGKYLISKRASKEPF